MNLCRRILERFLLERFTVSSYISIEPIEERPSNGVIRSPSCAANSVERQGPANDPGATVGALAVAALGVGCSGAGDVEADGEVGGSMEMAAF